MEFSKTLRNLRKEKGLTQTQLADILHTTQDSVSLWELGKSLPDIPTLINISKFFDVTTDYLLSLE